MTRVREETLEHGTRDGILRGLAVTGGVITSAGIVLAATFAVLGVLPLVFLAEVGFAVAFGVLLDTFLVRSMLVPALCTRHRPQDLVAVEAGPRRPRAGSWSRIRPPGVRQYPWAASSTPGAGPRAAAAGTGFRPGRRRTSGRSPRRAASGGSSRPAASPASASVSTAAVQRWRGPKVDSPAAAAQRGVEGAQELVHRLAGHVVVDQRLGQPLGQVRRALPRSSGAGGERQRQRAVGVQRHPGRAPSVLVAGALDQQPARRRARRTSSSQASAADVLVVLPQHVERAHQHRAQAGELESAAAGSPPAAGRGRRRPPRPAPGRSPGPPPRGRRPRRRAARPAPGGHRGGAVAQVDHQRPGGVAQPRDLGREQPAVHPAQPVGVRRAPGRQAQRAGPAGRQPGRPPLRRQRGPALVVAAPTRSPSRSRSRRPVSVAPCRCDPASGWPDLTTLAVGGPADRLVEVADAAELVAAVREADEAGRPLLVLGGGSNVVAPDEGWPGDVVAVRSRGVVARPATAGGAGRRALGRPGRRHRAASGWPAWRRSPASPARPARRRCRTSAPTARRSPRRSPPSASTTAPRRPSAPCRPADCGFAYRDSRLKREPGRFVVLDGDLRAATRASRPGRSRYAELATPAGHRGRRDARRWPTSAPPSSSSAGARAWCSTPPTPTAAARAPSSPTRWSRPTAPSRAARRWPAGDGLVKLSAAWLVEPAGFGKGTRDGRVGTSSRHSLALTTEPGATASELLGFAGRIVTAVRDRFGVELVMEPTAVQP